MASPKRAKRPPKTAGQKALAVVKWFGIAVLALAVLGAGTFAAVYAATPMPDPNKDFQTNTTQVFFADGKTEMGTFAVQNRVSLSFDEMPQNVKDAIVAGENATFWTDPGISVAGLARAVASALGPGDTVGGSTITQQYVKILYLSQDKTLERKLREIIIALKVGQEVSKEKILEGYLNTVYYGRGAYGIQAAAQAFFGVDAKDLTLQQAVVLASVINSPGNLDPANGAKQRADLLERYQYTLNEMVAAGTITQAERDKIYRKLPDFPKLVNDSRFGGPKGYLLRMVQQELADHGIDEGEINGGGLSVITTVDAKAQEAAVEAAQDAAYAAASERGRDPKNLHPALASIDVETGGILALYGGADFVENNRNWATTPRETGSTFKPWALVAALRAGFTLNDTFNGNSYTPRGDRDPVTNTGGSNYGPVTLIKATTSSINSAYVDIVSQLPGRAEDVIKAANDAGIPSGAGWDAYDRIALGNPQVSPLAAAAGYATLAREGKQIDPYLVREVKDRQGRTIYKASVSAKQAIEDEVAQDATYALTNVTSSGTGRRVSALGHPVAGKTGTKYDSVRETTTASWFVGYTRQISTAVMFVANDDGQGDLGAYSSGFYGSGYPAITWLDYMRTAMDGKERLQFEGPTQRVSTRKPATQAPAPRPQRTTAKPEPEKTQEPAPEPTQEPTQEPAPEPTQEPAPEPTQEPAPQPTRGGRQPEPSPTPR